MRCVVGNSIFKNVRSAKRSFDELPANSKLQYDRPNGRALRSAEFWGEGASLVRNKQPGPAVATNRRLELPFLKYARLWLALSQSLEDVLPLSHLVNILRQYNTI